jgi:hypothetical protein
MPPPAGPGAGRAQQPAMAEVVEELANGGNGLATLGRMLNVDDSQFWKGALIGAAAVLLLTNESLQQALFAGAAKAKDAAGFGGDDSKDGAKPAGDDA